jgi:hypothetical protein
MFFNGTQAPPSPFEDSRARGRASARLSGCRSFGLANFVVLAGLLGIGGRAYANFFSWSTTDILILLYLIAWPWVAGVLLLLLVIFWPQRQTRPRLYAILGVVTVLGSIPSGINWFSEWRDDVRRRAEDDFWESVSKAAVDGDQAKALRLLGTRTNGLQTYVWRALDQPLAPGDPQLIRLAFEQCVADLLDDSNGYLSLPLDRVITEGRPEIIGIWLDTPPCPRNDGLTREQRIAGLLNMLVPYTTRSDGARLKQLRANQAAALKLLVERYPVLLDVSLSDKCGKGNSGAERCPTLLSALFDNWHQEGVAAILPLDRNAEAHLPPTVVRVLRGPPSKATASSRADPRVFHQNLPALLATAPLDNLRAALRAAPPLETALLTPGLDQTQYQHLSSLFDATQRRDDEQPTWDYLWLLFDLFPSRLREVDTQLYERYVIGTDAGDPKLDELLTRLRAAGLSCKNFYGLAGWGDAFGTGRDWYRQKTGCPLNESAPGTDS